MKPSRLLLAGLLASAALAAEGSDPLAPLPRAAPLVPRQEATTLSAEELMLRKLDEAARDRDERIQAILRAAAGIRPVATADLGPGLERPRAERDRALVELRQALDSYLGRTHRAETDVLDASGAVRQARQLPPLSAANRLAVAECLRDLSAEEQGSDRLNRLDAGLAEIEALPAEMPDELRPRAAYLKVWFLAESARTSGSDPALVADRAKRARAAAGEFAGSFPGSELVGVVAALIADLPVAPP